MSKYRSSFSQDFLRDLKKIKSNFGVQIRLEKKIEEILENPHHYKILRNVLKNRRRAHIGEFVLVFEVKEDVQCVEFHVFKHHDEAYE